MTNPTITASVAETDRNGDFLVRTDPKIIYTPKWHDGLFEGAQRATNSLGAEFQTLESTNLDRVRITGELAAAQVSVLSASHGVPADPEVIALAVDEVSFQLRNPLFYGQFGPGEVGLKAATVVATQTYMEVSRIAA